MKCSGFEALDTSAGSERGVPLPAQAAQSTKATGDLLRRFKELGANMKSHPPPTAAEQELLVRPSKALLGGPLSGLVC